jgi:Fe-S cluster assembly iron-binding protein IscA
MNNEQIKALIAEQKKKANIVNNIAIEWENVKTAVAQIINNPNKESEEFKNSCELINSLCEDMKSSLEEIKNTICR